MNVCLLMNCLWKLKINKPKSDRYSFFILLRISVNVNIHKKFMKIIILLDTFKKWFINKCLLKISSAAYILMPSPLLARCRKCLIIFHFIFYTVKINSRKLNFLSSIFAVEMSKKMSKPYRNKLQSGTIMNLNMMGD